MLTRFMKWVSIAALLLALLWHPSATYELVRDFVVCMGALMVAWQAGGRGRYFWTVIFLSIAVLFNPVVPVVLSHKMFLWLGWVSLATFLISLAVLRSQRILSVPSITNRTPESESL